MKKLIEIQSELKAPKNMYNSFGKYHYRNCEGILEAVKPILKAKGCLLTLTDEIVNVGNSNYVKATVILSDGEDSISVSAYARESETKKGMDDSQITGTASSYARKYALNGLFLIDDTKDADSNEYTNENTAKADIPEDINEKINDSMAKRLEQIIELKNADKEKFLQYFEVEKVSDLTNGQYGAAVMMLSKKEKQIKAVNK